jgi:2-phospho-L-lactate guanylyltransferase
MPTACVLIPVKRLALAKSRLAPALAPAARRALASDMLGRVLSAVVTDPDPLRRPWAVAVVTSEPAAIALACAQNVAVVPEPAPRGLEDALRTGVQWLSRLGFGRFAFVPADVPQAEAADIEALIGGHDDGVRAVGAERDGAVNALSWPATIEMPFEFGPGSLERLVARVGALGVPFTTLDLPRLALDVDVPADLARPAAS